jgi:MoaA/NifB/PqqE/SkfB family radical SAM enzyme
MSMLQRLRALRRSPAPLSVAAEPQFDAYVDETSPHHVAGWLRDQAHDGRAVDFEAILPATGEIVAQGAADQFKFGPSNEGKGRHGFFTPTTRTLSEAERQSVVVRPRGSKLVIPRAGHCSAEYKPVMLIAMDIVNNCNLRCPFCVYDYKDTNHTEFMDEATIDAALRFLPYTNDSNFWFSCLHEPAMHPQFIDYLARVPADMRRKLFFTTNLAKRMPDGYFAFLADSGVANVNISIESMEPALYERMRKGARHRIFMENWNKLIPAFAAGKAPPFLRYIVMVYRSNLAEIPSLVAELVNNRRADQIQLRFTFDVPHIPPEFRATEYVEEADWDWLEHEMSGYPRDKVQVIRPPDTEAPPFGSAALPGRYEFKLSWDGTLKINRFWAVPFEEPGEDRVAEMNVKDIADPLALFAQLPR